MFYTHATDKNRIIHSEKKHDWLTHEKEEEHPEELCRRGPRQIFIYLLAQPGGLTTRSFFSKDNAQLPFALECHLSGRKKQQHQA